MQSIKNIGGAIAALNEVIEKKQTELNSYKQQTNHSAKAVFFKEAEIKNLTGILNAFTETLNEVESEFISMQKEINQQKQNVLKLEGCLLFHRIRPETIQDYKDYPLKYIIEKLKIVYNNEVYKQPKTSNKPLIPFKLLKEKALTGTCTDKTFKVQLTRTYDKN